MQKLTLVKRGASIASGLVFLFEAVYCLQFAVLENHLHFESIYYIGLLLLGVFLAIGQSQDVEFVGLDFAPSKLSVMSVFWVIIFAVFCAYFARQEWIGGSAEKARFAHFVVGVHLYAFGSSMVLGSYFSGLGLRLYVKNPVVWLKYMVMRMRGEI